MILDISIKNTLNLYSESLKSNTYFLNGACIVKLNFL